MLQLNNNQTDYSIVFIRGIAALAIVYLHIIAFWGQSPEHYEMFYTDNPFRFFVNATLHSIGTRWAVPVFLMITGALILNPNKEMPLEKIKSYIVRMLVVLITFGFVYNIIELVFTERTINIRLVAHAFLNLLQGQVWNHIAYIYALIGLYFLTPVFRQFVKSAYEKDINFVAISMFTLMVVVNTVNYYYNIKLTTFQIGSPISLFYFFVGYLIYSGQFLNCVFKSKREYIVLMLVGMLILWSSNMVGILFFDQLITFNTSPNFIGVAIMSIGLWGTIVHSDRINCLGQKPIFEFLSRHSFGIYLVHPFYMHILYKGLHLFPDMFPAFLGEALFMVSITGASILTSMLLHHLPGIKKII